MSKKFDEKVGHLTADLSVVMKFLFRHFPDASLIASEILPSLSVFSKDRLAVMLKGAGCLNAPPSGPPAGSGSGSMTMIPSLQVLSEAAATPLGVASSIRSSTPPCIPHLSASIPVTSQEPMKSVLIASPHAPPSLSAVSGATHNSTGFTAVLPPLPPACDGGGVKVLRDHPEGGIRSLPMLTSVLMLTSASSLAPSLVPTGNSATLPIPDCRDARNHPSRVPPPLTDPPPPVWLAEWCRDFMRVPRSYEELMGDDGRVTLSKVRRKLEALHGLVPDALKPFRGAIKDEIDRWLRMC